MNRSTKTVIILFASLICISLFLQLHGVHAASIHSHRRNLGRQQHDDVTEHKVYLPKGPRSLLCDTETNCTNTCQRYKMRFAHYYYPDCPVIEGKCLTKLCRCRCQPKIVDDGILRRRYQF